MVDTDTEFFDFEEGRKPSALVISSIIRLARDLRTLRQEMKIRKVRKILWKKLRLLSHNHGKCSPKK